MRHIRPYELFTRLADQPSERIANVKIPERRDLKLLETFLMIAAIRLVQARRIFEFGTYFGSTTYNFALNTPFSAEIFTFDLSHEEAQRIEQHPKDAPVTAEHFARKQMDFYGTEVAGKIKRVAGNSRTFDFSPWRDSVDLVFIDGGHDRATVESDTRNALMMTRKNAPACIFWHDYGNADYPDNTAFLEEMSTKLDIFHVEDTMLCGWFSHCVLRS